MFALRQLRAALSAFALVCSSGFCATYYVSPLGNDGPPNDGSLALPFREIRQALTLVQPGDTVLVADGQYLGFDVDSITGTAQQPITIQAQGSNAQVNVTTDRDDNRDTIFVTFSSYVVIDGLRSFNANRSAMRIDQSPNITARNCVFGNNTTWGIFTDFSDDLLIEGNECYGSVQQHGIYVSNTCTRPTVRGNRIHDNYANGLHMNGDVSQGGVGLITNALVEDNIIYNNGAGGGSGINCDGVQNSLFQNNLIYEAHGAGITLYQTDASGPSINATVINNTIDIASDGKWAIQIHNGSSGATVFNNIFLTHHSFHGSIHLTVPADQTGLVCDYNILTTNANVATPDNDSTDLTFAQWQALGYDTHSIQSTQDSCFVDWADGDYHLTSGSPAIDIGTATLGGKSAPLADIEGNGRPAGNGYDIGAYEFGSNPKLTITSGPSALPNPALPGQTVSFFVTSDDTAGNPVTYTWDFGDSTTGSGASPTHSYAAIGMYTVMVTASDGTLMATGSVTVTVNDSGSPAIVGIGPDTDGDGFSDAFETAVGTDPNSLASTPTGQPITAATLQALTLSKASIKLNFAATGKDSIAFSGTVNVPAGFVAAGSNVYFDVGGIAKKLVLTSKGNAVSGNYSFKVTIASKKGVVIKQTAKYAATFSKGSFAATLANSGLTNSNANPEQKHVVFTLIFNNVVLQKSQTMSYTAKMNKTGAAK